MTIARVALPVALDQCFDYWVPAGLALAPGSIVEARLGARRLHGVVVDVDDSTALAPERMRPLDAVADTSALPADVMELCKERGLLIGKGGLAGNTLRVKPPMCLTRDDVDFLADCLDEVMDIIER